MQTVYGILCDPLGHAFSGGKAWATPSSAVRAVQPAQIKVDQDHDGRPVGEIVHLERGAGGLWAVGRIEESVRPEVHVRVGHETRSVEHDLFWSAERVGDADTGIILLSVALTCWPARVSASPLTIVRSGLDQHGRAIWRRSSFEQSLLEHADAAERRHRYGEPILVHEEERAGAAVHDLDLASSQNGLENRPRAGTLELRSATAVDVNRARRELDLLIAPAETPVVIREPGNRYTEVFTRGAFAGTDPHSVKVNRDHVRERVMGRMLTLDPWAAEGLTGTAKLSRTRDADEALALIEDELLGVSAGFGVLPGGDEWQGSNRRVRHAVLDHVSLVVEAAYPSARVTAVRAVALR